MPMVSCPRFVLTHPQDSDTSMTRMLWPPSRDRDDGRPSKTVGEPCIEIRYDMTLSLACSTSALLLQPGLDVLHNHDDIMITYLIFLSPYL